VIGGLKIGTWFVKEGTLGHDYPNWMKYLGFFIDFSYQRLVMHGEGTTSNTESGQYGTWDPPRVVFLGMGNYSSSATGRNNFVSEGMAATLAFMFTARYGLLADSDVPFGRLQPYVAVGPGILFTSQNIKFSYTDPSGRGYSIQDSDSATNICLVADAGIRWMAFKSVSIDAFFRYRYAAPQYSYMKTLNLFSGNLGVAYHF
jgi:opacity protein-like surface antigen